MDNLILYADRIVSVAEPYVNDKFVGSRCRPVLEEELERCLETYANLLSGNALLNGLLSTLARANVDQPVQVVDIGVFMGSFSIAIGLCARRLGHPLHISAHEANPLLVSSIAKNFDLYGIGVSMHSNAIGGDRTPQKLVVNVGNAIAGSISASKVRMSEHYECTVDCISLADAIPAAGGMALVKIDIEGAEVAAFSSIVGNDRKLDNIFIVEFNPYHCDMPLTPDQLYGDFLLEHFNVFNIGNWGWFAKAIPVIGRDALKGCDLGNGGNNTDLLLLPKSLDLSAVSFIKK